MRIGILTGGGDCPGLNAVIRAVARRSFGRRATRSSAFAKAGAGSSRARFAALGPHEISGILPRGGTIIGTSAGRIRTRSGRRRRERPRAPSTSRARRARRDRRRGHAGRRRAAPPEHGFPVVGVPKTIDNDLSGTDYTFGFDTAVTIATEAIDRLHTTAESHNRVMVVEVMGRHTGWIAVMSGIAGGADVILIPEDPITVEEACARLLRRHDRRQGLLDRRRQRGLRADVRVGREHASSRGEARASDQFGHVRLGGVGTCSPRDRGAHRLRDARHRARPRPARRHADGPRPRARDALRAEGGDARPRPATSATWPRCTGDEIVDVSLDEATAELKTVPPEWYEVARAFFG